MIVCYIPFLDAQQRIDSSKEYDIRSEMLDHLAEGLQTLGMLKIMRLLPKKFVHVFTYTALSANDVMECLCIPANLEDSGDAVAKNIYWVIRITVRLWSHNCTYMCQGIKLFHIRFLNQVRAAHAWFLEIIFVKTLVCVVCVRPPGY